MKKFGDFTGLISKIKTIKLHTYWNGRLINNCAYPFHKKKFINWCTSKANSIISNLLYIVFLFWFSTPNAQLINQKLVQL